MTGASRCGSPSTPRWRRRRRLWPTTSPITRTTSTTACARACSRSTTSPPRRSSRELIAEIEALHPGLEPSRKVHELSRRVITRFVEDALRETAARLAQDRVETCDDARRAGRAMFAFSPAMAQAEREIKAFLFTRMYRHPQVNAMRAEADRVVRALFAAYVERPDEAPAFWAARARRFGPERAAADYLAGMTDRFALGEYRRLFDPNAGLR